MTLFPKFARLLDPLAPGPYVASRLRLGPSRTLVTQYSTPEDGRLQEARTVPDAEHGRNREFWNSIEL